MKTLKTILIVFLSFITLLVVWFNLPLSIRRSATINLGNKFAENIRTYERMTGKLPKEGDWETLTKLYPGDFYEVFYPEYLVTDDNDFTLTYIEGFDGPYLQYDSKTKKWEMK